MSLSVTLAAYNEENNIERCLASIYDIADEIILVDGNSTDATVERAHKHDKLKKLHVIHMENIPENFHIMKKRANDAAKSDWILQIDADEAVSPKLAREIATTISQDDAADGYWIPRLNYFLTRPLRKGGQYPDRTLRLYRRLKGTLGAQDVHEQATVSGSTAVLKHDLLHYPYPTFRIYIEKWVRYTTIDAENAYAAGVRPSAGNFFTYCIWKPKIWFLMTYFRHRAYVDGFPGFMFSLFSALRFPAQYARIYEMSRSSS